MWTISFTHKDARLVRHGCIFWDCRDRFVAASPIAQEVEVLQNAEGVHPASDDAHQRRKCPAYKLPSLPSDVRSPTSHALPDMHLYV